MVVLAPSRIVASYAGEADPYRKPHEDDELDESDATDDETPPPAIPQDT